MSNEKHSPKSIISIFPLISVLIVLAGYVSAAKYYKKFGIEIFYYLEPTEIVTSFLANYGVYINVVALVPILAILFVPSVAGVKKEFLNAEEFSWWMLFFGFLLIWAVFFAKTAEFHVYWGANYIPILAILGILLYISRFTNKTKEFEFFKLRFIELSSFFILLLLAFHTAQKDYYLVYEKKKYYGHIVVLKNGKSLISDSTNYFIGQTKNYIFWYDQKENEHSVIKIDDVEQIRAPRWKYNLNHKSAFDQ